MERLSYLAALLRRNSLFLVCLILPVLVFGAASHIIPNNTLVQGTLGVSGATTLSAAANIATANGLDVNPGSDIDADLVTVGVTGSPKFQWIEAYDSFRLTNNLILGATGEGTHTINGVSVVSGLEVHSEGGTDPGGLSVHRHSNSTLLGGDILGIKSRGTHATPTIVQSGDPILWLLGVGYDGTDYAQSSSITFKVDGTPGTDDMPGRIELATSADGAQAPTVAVTVDASQNVNIHSAKELRFQDTTGGQYMGFKAPGTVTSSTTLTLPDGDGTNGQVLSTNGSGTLAWAAAGSGSTAWTIQSKTTTYTAAANEFVKADATSGAFTVTLPAASGNSGVRIVIQKTDSSANLVTIARAGSDTIQGATSKTLNNQYSAIELVSDGTSLWSIKSRAVPQERISANITSVTATTAADTATDVTGGSISVTPGKWKIGYKVATRVQRIGSTGDSYGRVHILDPSSAIMEPTISFVGSGSMVSSESIYDTVSSYQIVDVTTTGTYKLQITSYHAAASGIMHIIANTYGFFTGADAYSEIYAERIE